MPLKMKPEHLEAISTAIVPLDTMANRERYIRGDFPNADKVQNLAKRYRWDLLYAATKRPYSPTTKWVCDNLYPYLNDDHIDSALREILGMDHRSRLDPAGARNLDLAGDKL